jgi:hypothetical protein
MGFEGSTMPANPSKELRRIMSDKESAQSVIDAYRRRQQTARRAPIIIGIAALFLIVGAGIVIFWLLGPESPSFELSFLATETPTATNTATPPIPPRLPTQQP